jgi:hypothetical protein
MAKSSKNCKTLAVIAVYLSEIASLQPIFLNYDLKIERMRKTKSFTKARRICALAPKIKCQT